MTVRVQTEAFDAGVEMARMQQAGTHGTIGAIGALGALASFVGICRGRAATANDSMDDAVQVMEIEHYPGMTEAAIAAIEAQARQRWDLLDVLIVHRYGKLLPGEPIVLVLVASAHRGDAFAACAFIMDYLKTEAPFWKKERTAKREHWVEARAEDEAARQRWES